MPLTFSESEETQQKQENLCKTKNQSPASAASDVILSCKENKSDDLSFERQNQMYNSEEFEEDLIVETTALRNMSEESKSFCNPSDADNYLTVSGTIKRGKKKGQNVEVVLNMSREELEVLEANMTRKKGCPCTTTNKNGFHVFLWTIVCLPFSMVISGVYSFYMGTITWYNVFKFFSEDKPLAYRVFLPPLLIILYPFMIISISVGLALYAGLKQLSCCWHSWQKEFIDYEKGFFGWLCNALDIPECSPYEVVILSAIHNP